MEVREISRELGVSEDELVKRGVKAYLETELRKIRSEMLNILVKYKVDSLKELDDKVSKGELSESDTFDDFTRLDYLESMKEKIERLLGGL
nr:hypothetical protein [Candidatus Njordarchaeota archaeon]